MAHVPATVSAGAWHSLRLEVDSTTGDATWLVDGVADTSNVLPAVAFAGRSVVLNSGGSCCGVSPSVCWSNLEVYESP